MKLGRRRREALLATGLVAIASLARPAVAQEDVKTLVPGETLYEIRLADGSVLFARVTAVEGESMVLVTAGGARLEVERSQIRDVRPAEGRLVEDMEAGVAGGLCGYPNAIPEILLNNSVGVPSHSGSCSANRIILWARGL